MNNLLKYKKALIHTREIPKAIHALEESISKLEKFSHYVGISDCILTLKENRDILKIYLAQQEKTRQSKGLK